MTGPPTIESWPRSAGRPYWWRWSASIPVAECAEMRRRGVTIDHEAAAGGARRKSGHSRFGRGTNGLAPQER
jgi:hypothetical protein